MERPNSLVLGFREQSPSQSTPLASSSTTPKSIRPVPAQWEQQLDSLVKSDPNLNKLIFPEDPSQDYIYNKEDFEHIVTLVTTNKSKVKYAEYKKLMVNNGEHGKPVALKYINICLEKQNLPKQENTRTDAALKKLLDEINYFRDLSKYENIVDFYGLCFDMPDQIVFCMEYMDLSLENLYKWFYEFNPHNVAKRSSNFPEKIIGFCLVKIIEALDHCKKIKIMHRDVKPGNILLNISGEVKLCDFGESKILDNNSLAHSYVGTYAYWPPERFDGSPKKYDIRADIWSLGITLAEVAYGACPLGPREAPIAKGDLHVFNTVQMLIKATQVPELIDRCLKKGHFSESLREFVQKCLQPESDRPSTYDELMNLLFYEDSKAKIASNITEVAEFVYKYTHLSRVVGSSRPNMDHFDNIQKEFSKLEPKKEIARKISYLDLPMQEKVYEQLEKIVEENRSDLGAEENYDTDSNMTNYLQNYVAKVVPALICLPSFLPLYKHREQITKVKSIFEKDNNRFPLIVGDEARALDNASRLAQFLKLKFVVLNCGELPIVNMNGHVEDGKTSRKSSNQDTSYESVLPSKLVEVLSSESSTNLNELEFYTYDYEEPEPDTHKSFCHLTIPNSRPVECFILTNIDAIPHDDLSFLHRLLDLNKCHAFDDEFIRFSVDLSGIYFICTARDCSVIPQDFLNKYLFIHSQLAL